MPCCQGKLGELAKNSWQNPLYSSFCVSVFCCALQYLEIPMIDIPHWDYFLLQWSPTLERFTDRPLGLQTFAENVTSILCTQTDTLYQCTSTSFSKWQLSLSFSFQRWTRHSTSYPSSSCFYWWASYRVTHLFSEGMNFDAIFAIFQTCATAFHSWSDVSLRFILAVNSKIISFQYILPVMLMTFFYSMVAKTIWWVTWATCRQVNTVLIIHIDNTGNQTNMF